MLILKVTSRTWDFGNDVIKLTALLLSVVINTKLSPAIGIELSQCGYNTLDYVVRDGKS